MKEKLTLQDLVDLLAKKTSLTKKEADAFFREFFTIIIDEAFNNEPVKVKDFGTFKLTRVNSRESVNVNTGEKIEIPAHFKLSFIPDKTLKNSVNKPFSHFETTLLEEGVTFDTLEELEEQEVELEDEDTAIDEVGTPQYEDVAQAVVTEEDTAIEAEEIASLVGETVQPVEIETVVNDNIITEKETKDAEKSLVAAASPFSFVYTYKAEEKIGDTEAITMVVPKDEIVIDSLQKSQSEAVKDKVSSLSASIIENFNLDDIDLNPASPTPLEINKVQEKIDQLKEAIEALTKVKQQSESILKKKEEDLQKVSGQATEDESITDFPEEIDFTHEVDPKEDNLPNDFCSEDREFLGKLEPVSHRETVDSQSQEVNESGNEEVYEEPYDYYKVSLWSRIRSKIPLAVFMIFVVGFGIYIFFKLLNNTTYNNYDIYGNIRKNTPTTTYPYVNQAASPVVAADSLLNTDSLASVAGSDTVILTDGLSTTRNSKAEENAEIASELVGGSVINPNIDYEKVISDNLKIKVLSKALAQLSKVDSVRVQNSVTETVKPGATLRSIAARHYGNNAFWVYLFEENKDKISNVDNIGVGIVLTIPDLKKYGVDAQSPDAIEKAKSMEQGIFDSARR